MTTTYSCREIINTKNLNRIMTAKKIDHNTLTELRKLKRRLGKSNQHEVKFQLSNDGENPGRLYPKRGAMSLQNLKKDVRKALAHDTYTDIDMVNAHPTILSQLFARLNIPCPNMDTYIAEREKILAETGMPRDDAKQAFISLMYGGKPYDNATPFMVNFHTELTGNATKILGLPEYHKYKDMGEIKKPTNAVGSALGYLAQDIERECVMTMVNAFKADDYEVGTIIHDGFLVQSTDVKDETLRSAEQSVKLLLKYDIKLEKKDLTDFDDNNLWGEDDDGNGVDEIQSETEMARTFIAWLDTNGHRVLCFENKFYWFDPKVGVYREDFRQLRLLVDECPDLPEDKRGKTKFQDIMEKQVKAILDEDTDFGFKLIDTTYRKIPFKNGVYCVETKELIDYNRDMFFTKRGTIDYEPQSKELKEEVCDKLFLGVFGTHEVAKYFLQCLARSIAGDIGDKLFFIVQGRTNSGKGVITELVFIVFQSIFGNYNIGNLCDKRTDGDTAKINSWKVPLRSCRVAVANEKCSKKLDGEAMKMSASGGDPQTARQNNQNEITFKLQCLFWLFCNDPPNFIGLDEAGVERLRVFTTAYKYLLPDKYEASKDKDGKVPDFVKKADPKLKAEWLKRKDVQQAFAQLVCEAWLPDRPVCPKSILDQTKQLVDEISDDAKVQELVVETGNAEDKLSLPQLQTKLKIDGIDLTITSIKKKLMDMGHPETKFKRDWNPAKEKKILYLCGAKLATAKDDEPLVFSNDH
tara:strand:+ start:621 stop:2873 length:2253 start_codon:yes stop_codon:yes gene_type:complete